MLVGHVAAALVGKQVQPRLSLGTLVVAALLADMLLFALVLGGVEDVRFRATDAPGSYFTGVDVALSHSLVTTAGWAAALAALRWWRRRDRAAAIVLAAVVISHWVLDIISHEPFLPFAPGVPAYLGWGATSRIAVTMAIEGAVWVGALALYVSDSRSANSAGRYVFWGGVAAWTWVWYVDAYGAPRPAADAPREALIVLALIVVWAYWMDRARVMKEQDSGA